MPPPPTVAGHTPDRRSGTHRADPAATATDGTAQAPGPAATPASDDRVRNALAAGPNSTVPELVTATGLSRSTVFKTLTRLETAGKANRTRAEAQGTPDRWNPSAPDTGPTREPTPTNPTPAPEPATGGTPESEASAATEPDTGLGPQPDDTPETEPGPTTEPDTRTDPDTDTGAEPDTGTESGSDAGPAPDTEPGAETSAPRGPEAEAVPAVTADARPEDATTAVEPARNPRSGTTRLAPRALTQLVAEYFAARPDTGFTAGEVARELGGRSAGAVRNAADKLLGDGILRLANDHPRRYTAA